MPLTVSTEHAADTLRVLSHPVRLQIMEHAAAGEISVGALSSALGLGQPTTSQHLRVLRDHGLLQAKKDGQRRLYSVSPGPLEEVRFVLDGIWTAPLERLRTAAEQRAGG
ncbi:MAG: metalloregulator ArsR/SmtB family transcription factor [Actinomycetota bacterium]